jgi:hypothetical protein
MKCALKTTKLFCENGIPSQFSQTLPGRTFIAVLWLGILLFIMGQAALAAEDELPLTIKAYGHDYTIKSFEPGMDDDGNTKITVTGAGFEILPFRNGAIAIPVMCLFVSGGKEIEMESASFAPTEVEYSFSSAKKPVAVKFFAGDERDRKYEFPCD